MPGKWRFVEHFNLDLLAYKDLNICPRYYRFYTDMECSDVKMVYTVQFLLHIKDKAATPLQANIAMHIKWRCPSNCVYAAQERVRHACENVAIVLGIRSSGLMSDFRSES